MLIWVGICKLGDGLGIVGDEVLIVVDDVVVVVIGLVDLLLVLGGDLVMVLIGVGVIEDVVVVLEWYVYDYYLGIELVFYCIGYCGDVLLIGVE